MINRKSQDRSVREPDKPSTLTFKYKPWNNAATSELNFWAIIDTVSDPYSGVHKRNRTEYHIVCVCETEKMIRKEGNEGFREMKKLEIKRLG